ncbi:hypothetical protein I5E47_02665 [Pseudomonas aeruginosa]|nr:hypothetical protein [Pseudomonas aeruginosa]MBG5654154.1 hypothetical protein [Pseudomonas aeruginosa]MBG7077651.1 hypothetical protein [Pseudomonas aeruginosa]
MTNELTDVRCPCGTEFPAESYDAGFIAGSGMCQNCDAAMPPKDIPAPVEQAGGDERAAFELFVRKHCGMPAHIAVNWDAKFTNDAWAGWQARAALAQPSPAQAEEERPKIVATLFTPNEKVHDDIGFKAFAVAGDCDKDGGEFYDPEKLMTVAQHERIVKAWIERWKAYIELSAKIAAQRDAANARLHEVATACATAEQERDAAQARVAELERGKVYVEARRCDECQHGGINDSATGVAACHECDWTGPEPEEDKCPGCQRENCMAAACPQCGARYVLVASEEIAAPVAQAQHSVPEGWKLVPIEPTQAQLSAGQTAWLADPMRRSTTLYRAMLAAAPQPVAEGE